MLSIGWKNWRCVLLLILVFNLAAQGRSEQQHQPAETVLVEIVVKDGNRLRGTILKESEQEVLLETPGGLKVTIPVDLIASRKTLGSALKAGRFFQADHTRNRLMLAPTALPMKRGEAYFSVFQLFFPFVAAGFTNRLAVGVGVSLIPGTANQLAYIAPKLTLVQREQDALAVGILHILVPGGGSLGLGYAVATTGTEAAGLTVGVGFPYLEESLGKKPVWMFGGSIRLNEKVILVSENWFPPDQDLQFLSLGLRFLGTSLAGDFGLLLPVHESLGGFPMIPLVGFSYRFRSH